MYVLEDLWWGNVRPCERNIRKNSEYERINSQSVECLNAFYKELSPEGKKAYHAYQEHETKLNQITDIDTFIRGVRFGVRLMMDVMGDYTSPLPQRNEMEAAE